jgi:hypothetical protein
MTHARISHGKMVCSSCHRRRKVYHWFTYGAGVLAECSWCYALHIVSSIYKPLTEFRLVDGARP